MGAESLPGRAVRRATYRVQMHAGFTFDDAAAVAGYLGDLGISHLYLSPVLQAAPGSTHGYDVVDPTRVNSELGGEEGHRRLQDALGSVGLGQLLDIVPNHMAITGRDNAWWWDVLENGPASVYASYFDVDWDPPESKLRNVVLLPILGDHYGRVLESGDLTLAREHGSFVLRYFDHAAPVSPRSYDEVLDGAAARLEGGGSDPMGNEVGDPRLELESLATAFAKLPHAERTDPDSVRERHRDKEVLKGRLATLLDSDPVVAAAVDGELAALNADLDRLDGMLERQNYRLAWWRTAGEELDYRRFFDINDLAGIRVEDPQVFEDSHRLILSWLHDGVIDGVRIDHVDGLADPAGYLERLAAAAPGAWVLVEKIIEGEETLPPTWLADGTTGYDWMTLLGSVLSHGPGEAAVRQAYRSFSGVDERFEEVVHAAKVEILEGSLAADLSRLTARFSVICEQHRRYRDYTRKDVRDALAAVLAAFGVYRTYVRPGSPVTDTDVRVVDSAVLTAGVRHPEIDDELLGFLRDVLLLRVPAAEGLALRFQQLSGPVMAKAVEDTAFYRWVPTTWRNEVGGDPGRAPIGLEAFHAACAATHHHHPAALLGTSTHDTKRSEDVRARLSVLAEDPERWASTAEGWRAHNSEVRQAPPPDRSTEWLLYQTLVGAWPIDAERMKAYMAKATHEAKSHTSWTDPDEYYDQALAAYIDELLGDATVVAEVSAYVDSLLVPGRSVGLAQKLLTLTAPGVPDLYQGSECWDLSLVDPDNRRPVDYDRHRRLLTSLEGRTASEAWATESGDGATKLAVVRSALEVRGAHPAAFGPGPDGGYEPLRAEGSSAEHLIGFTRGGRVATLATRFPLVLERSGGWGDTTVTLGPGRWGDSLSGATHDGGVPLPLADVLASLPVALLVRS